MAGVGEIKYWIIRGVVGTMLYLLGGWSTLLKAMFIFIVVDYATGILKSLYLKKISSKIAYKGLIKKCSYILAVIIGATFDEILIETHITTTVISLFGLNFTARDLIILAIIGNEGISIIENLGEMDIILPNWLKTFFQQIKQENEDK